jgi:hypothetical protein
MINYKETFEQYKNDFDKNFKNFISLHKGIDLTMVDFINREKAEWLKIEAILTDRRDEKLGYMSCLKGELFEMQFEVNDAIAKIGIEGEEFISYKCDAILKFLNDKLESLNDGHNIDKIEFDSDVFFNAKGFKIFEKFIEKSTSSKDDFSFIYRQLIQDKFMKDIPQASYKDFCAKEPYSKSLDKIKTIHQVGIASRNNLYSLVLEHFR